MVEYLHFHIYLFSQNSFKKALFPFKKKHDGLMINLCPTVKICIYQIRILEWCLKDDVTLRTGVMAAENDTNQLKIKIY